MSTIANLSFGIALLTASGAALLGSEHTDLRRTPPDPESIQRGVQAANELSTAFRQVSRDASPSVVTVTSVKPTLSTGGTIPGLPPGFIIPFGRNQGRMPDQTGMGTGFVYDDDGTIVTNAHVVSGARDVRVRLADGQDLTAKVVGVDTATDIAVLRVDAQPPALRIGNSDVLEVGDWVLAIGSPLGLNQTMTAGIVSAKGRSNVGLATYEEFIQTDAAINPGNSGGPLLNLNGEVVGINTAIASMNGGNVGIGFSIPIAMADHIIQELRADGHVRRGRLGVQIQELTPDLARSFHFNGSGVLVGDVVSDSPAERAGVQAGDIIRSWDGRAVTDVSALRNAVASTQPGDAVELTIVREGVEQTLRVTPDALPENATAAAAERDSEQLGVEIATATAAMRAEVDGMPAGVVVRNVLPGTLAARAGLRTGDVIVAVADRPVREAEEFRQAVKRADLDAGVLLRVWADGGHRFAMIRKS